LASGVGIISLLTYAFDIPNVTLTLAVMIGLAVGIIVAFVVLLITFGSVIAAGLPIISALIGLASGVGIISLLTYAFDIPNVTLTLAVMIGLAVGIIVAFVVLL
ncbi:MMPL family transporter, partial [Staphylococcus aureus]|uniref:MMPL family transporter n=1 Tax=Staphylococcus aureus TaxID=1280 RepID=UPI00210C9B05